MRTSTHASLKAVRSALVAFGVVALLHAAPAAAQPAQSVELEVNAGKSKVMQLPSAYSDVMVADPKIADVLPLDSRSIYVIGKGMGATAVMVYGPGKHLIVAANVLVSADLESLRNRLHDILPNETDIAVRPANQSIAISGTVSNAAALQQVLALTDSYAPGKVVNMLGVQGTQQVMLSVRFVEMERSTAKDLQLNLQSAPQRPGESPSFSIHSGDTINGNTNLLTNLFGSGALRFGSGKGGLDLIFDALETKGLVKTLAEPTLVAMSGDTASFLAGGEFPIPVQQTSGGAGTAPTITVEFKQFGVSLAFTPTILRDGLINLSVNPEVSDIDPSTSFNLGTIKVPGIKVRRAHTTVELRDGESFTIAGLLRDNYTNQIRGYPFIGDIPVLGALFRSTGYQKDETELVIVVTPHLVTPRRGATATPADYFTPPSDLELFLLGSRHRHDPAPKGDKGAVDGPHGHVLF
jgi:pilus assembly protein CpaC